MRRTVALALTLTLAVLLGSGCRARPAVLKDLASVYDKNLVYLGKSGNDHAIVDTSDDKRYLVPAANGGVLTPLPAFAAFSLGPDGDGSPFLRTGTMLAVDAPIVAAKNAAEAAVLYPEALLESLRFRRGSDYALQDFSIRSSKVLLDKDGIIRIEFVADLKPAVDEFVPGTGSRWGQPGTDGFVSNRRLVVKLYSHNGRYGLYAPNGEIFAEGAPPVGYTAPATLYRPPEYADQWQALESGEAVERVLYEDDKYSFIFHLRLRLNPDFFESTLYRIDRASGERLALFDLPRDTWVTTALGLQGRTLYLGTVIGHPYSEGRNGPVTALDLDTGSYRVLLAGETQVIGSAGDTLYIVSADASGEKPGLYALEIATGAVTRIGNAPCQGADEEGPGGFVQHVSDGRLYVLAPEPSDKVPGPLYAFYTVDLKTGVILKTGPIEKLPQ